VIGRRSSDRGAKLFPLMKNARGMDLAGLNRRVHFRLCTLGLVGVILTTSIGSGVCDPLEGLQKRRDRLNRRPETQNKQTHQ